MTVQDIFALRKQGKIERNLIEHRGSKKTGGYHAL